MIIAIHPDDYTYPEKPPGSDASSPRWARVLEAAGHQVRWVDVRRADILDQLKGCDGFMWRWPHFDGGGRIARRLLPVIERELGLATYPDQNTCWHYDDKIAQAYLLEAAGVPVPKTWVWFDKKAALDWASNAPYPVVLKLAGGAGSRNVRLIRNDSEARLWVERLFSRFVRSLDDAEFVAYSLSERVRNAARVALKGRARPMWDDGYEPQAGYVLFQEFLPNNSFDTRVTVIGNRAFAFRRFNRDNDFRASGSGRIDWSPEAVDEGSIRCAFKTAQALHTQSCASDGLYRGRTNVIAEISYTYVSEAVFKCPGHWELEGDPEPGRLDWVPGQMWPEEAQAQDFVQHLNSNAGRSRDDDR